LRNGKPVQMQFFGLHSKHTQHQLQLVSRVCQRGKKASKRGKAWRALVFFLAEVTYAMIPSSYGSVKEILTISIHQTGAVQKVVISRKGAKNAKYKTLGINLCVLGAFA